MRNAMTKLRKKEKPVLNDTPWVGFNDKEPPVGDLILVQMPPEQNKLPFVTLWMRHIEILEGSLWMPIPKTAMQVKEEGKKMRMYISGKITGLPMHEVVNKFSFHATLLMLKGYLPINPMEVSKYSDCKTWHDYMEEDIAALLRCDAIYMLKDWGQSKGARVEYQIAKEMGLAVFFEGEFN